jgi:Holliday junction DNA helicase RuvA
MLMKLPGVGARAAQKIVATLKGKVTATALLQDERFSANGAAAAATVQASAHSEAVEALVNLGYRPAEAREQVDRAVRRNPAAGEDVQELVREVFRSQSSVRSAFQAGE